MIFKRAFASIVAVPLLCSALHAQKQCSAETKFLISPPTIQSVVDSLKFEKQGTGRVYFFDTESLALLAQGVIVRVRQGAKNDLSVKVRKPEGSSQFDTARLSEQFQCEIDQTERGRDMSFSVGRKFKNRHLPETGNDIWDSLSPQQLRLLKEARVSITWSQVKRIASIDSTTWKSTSIPNFAQVVMESWDSPEGNILELSARIAPDQTDSKSADLQQIVKSNGLTPRANQGTKTSLVLKAMALEASSF